MGHPLGCTGARQIATGLSEAKREKKKIFVTSMCIGSGMVSAQRLVYVFARFLTNRVWLRYLSMSSKLLAGLRRERDGGFCTQEVSFWLEVCLIRLYMCMKW